MPQLRAQELREQVVVAVPGRLRLDAVDEEVVRHEPLGDVGAVGAARHRVREIGCEPLGDRGREQEVADVVRLAPQHLREQVLGGGTLVERERLEHRRVRLALPVREHEQPQSGRPALGAGEQGRERLRLGLHLEAVEELARLAPG